MVRQYKERRLPGLCWNTVRGVVRIGYAFGKDSNRAQPQAIPARKPPPDVPQALDFVRNGLGEIPAQKHHKPAMRQTEGFKGALLNGSVAFRWQIPDFKSGKQVTFEMRAVQKHGFRIVGDPYFWVATVRG